MSAAAPGPEVATSFVVAVEGVDRATAETLRVEIVALARAYGATVEDFRVERVAPRPPSSA